MTGEDFIAEVISTRSVCGIGVGSRLAEAADDIRLPYGDDVSGRRDNRTLRRDYGLFEVTCEADPEWVCRWVTLQVHRLSTMPGLRQTVSECLGVDFDRYTEWSKIEKMVEDWRKQPISYSGYQVFHSESTGVTVYVVDDQESVRADYPGHGDVWSIAIAPTRREQEAGVRR
jgi:ribosomal protein S18 acetylase RimI-like enzyme